MEKNILDGGLKVFLFFPYLGKWSNLTNTFQLGWTHQLESVDCKGRVDIISGPTIWRTLPHPSACWKNFKFRRSPLFIEGFPWSFLMNHFFGANKTRSSWQVHEENMKKVRVGKSFCKCWQRFETAVNFQFFFKYPNSAGCSILNEILSDAWKGFLSTEKNRRFFCTNGCNFLVTTGVIGGVLLVLHSNFLLSNFGAY